METAKVDLLVRAVSEAGRHPDPVVAAMLMRFYRDTPPEDLLGLPVPPARQRPAHQLRLLVPQPPSDRPALQGQQDPHCRLGR